MINTFYKSFILWLVIGIITSLLCYYTLNRFLIVYANTHSNSINAKLESMQKTINGMNTKTISINNWVETVKLEWFTIECE